MWGATLSDVAGTSARGNFNPRSPCGERREDITSISLPTLFQSTLPVWGATLDTSMEDHVADISIHAPRVGSDTAPWGYSKR